MSHNFSTYRSALSISSVQCSAATWLMVVFFCFGILVGTGTTLNAQDKTHSKKLEKVKKKKSKKKKDKKAAQYRGKIEPSATNEVKGNPTRKSKRTSGKGYQEQIGGGKQPKGTKGTSYTGKGKRKAIEKSKGTRHRGDAVPMEKKVAGNPTKKKTTGAKYQQRIGVDGPPKGTKGTNFSGRSKPKAINGSNGTNYKGAKIPLESTRIKGNPTKNVDKKGKRYLERTGQQGTPSGTKGTRFAGKGRPKTIKAGNDGTTYSGQSTAGSTSNAGGRTTIYGERGRNNKGGGAPDIKKRDQGAQWKGNSKQSAGISGTAGTNFKGNLKGNKSIDGTPGTRFQGNLKGSKSIQGSPGTRFQGNLKGSKSIQGSPGTRFQGNLKGSKAIQGTPGTRFKGNMKLPNREILDYGGDWAGDLKLKKTKPNTRASTYAIKGMRAKDIPQGEGTTFRGHLKSSKKIVGWDGADFQGHLKVKPNKKLRTEGTTYAGNLRVKPNAKTKTPGTEFAGHYKVRPNAKIKTEGMDYRGRFRTSTQFFKKRHYKKQSREQQLFAGNYKVRRNKGKDLHPSATYSGGRLKDPNKRNDLSRKWKLLVAKTKKNADQPKHLKSKGKKPKYDPKESDIWNE